MTLIYCSKAAQAEVARAHSWERWSVRKKSTLGLVPVSDGKCPFCGEKVRTIG